MNSNATETREPLAPDVTQAEIDKLIAERRDAGATGCKVEGQNDDRVLVCQWPPL